MQVCRMIRLICHDLGLRCLYSNINVYDHNCVASGAEVQDAMRRLKPGKNDGSPGLSSDYFIHAYSELSVHISLLFSSLIVHGFTPGNMLVSTVIPIPKGRNVNTADSANYRGISLSSVFVKLFDLLVLSRYGDCLCL